MASSAISLFYQNVWSLRTKISQFFHSVASSEFNIVYLSEPWLRNNVQSCDLLSQKYQVSRRDREYSISVRKDGGGESYSQKWRICGYQSTTSTLVFKKVYKVCAYLHQVINFLIQNSSITRYCDWGIQFTTGNLGEIISSEYIGSDRCRSGFINVFSVLGLSQFNSVKNKCNRILDWFFSMIISLNISWSRVIHWWRRITLPHL